MEVYQITYRTSDGKLHIFDVSGPSGSTARHEAEKQGRELYGYGVIKEMTRIK